jgi:hypothetical protein
VRARAGVTTAEERIFDESDWITFGKIGTYLYAETSGCAVTSLCSRTIATIDRHEERYTHPL